MTFEIIMATALKPFMFLTLMTTNIRKKAAEPTITRATILTNRFYNAIVIIYTYFDSMLGSVPNFEMPALPVLREKLAKYGPE
jgi:hypothetical protein